MPYHDILHYLPYLCVQRLCHQEIDLSGGKYDSTHYHSVSKSKTHGDQNSGQFQKRGLKWDPRSFCKAIYGYCLSKNWETRLFEINVKIHDLQKNG